MIWTLAWLFLGIYLGRRFQPTIVRTNGIFYLQFKKADKSIVSQKIL